MSDSNLTIAKYEKIGALNLLKFLLVFITFLFHWRIHFGVTYNHVILLDKFINAGAFAMSGFFILSGFLLYYIYSKKDFSNFDYLRNFFLKRTIKILPSYYIIILIMYLLTVFVTHKSVSWEIILSQIIPIQAFFPNYFNEWLVGGLWFVSVLLFLYFLFPYLCFIVKSVKKIIPFSVGIYLLGILPFIVECYHNVIGIYYLPPFRICEFIAGMITARLFIASQKQIKNGILYMFITMLLIYLGVGGLISNNFLHHHRFNYISLDVILLILFPVLIYLLSSIKNKNFILITNNKFSDYLGNIAYAFFITQFICHFIVKNLLKPNNYYGLNSLELLILSFVLSIILAIVLYECFEKPISRLLITRFIK